MSFGALSNSPSLGALASAGRGLRAQYLATSPTYAWLGGDLPASGPIAEWRCAVTDVVATASGTPTVGTLNGRRAAMLAGGSDCFTLPTLAGLAVEAIAAVIVFQPTTAGVSRQLFAINGTAADTRFYASLSALNLYAVQIGLPSTSVFAPPIGANVAAVGLALGSVGVMTAQVAAGGVTGASTNAYPQNGITGNGGVRTLGAFVPNSSPFIGRIADALFYSGPDYVARAAAAFDVARAAYGL